AEGTTPSSARSRAASPFAGPRRWSSRTTCSSRQAIQIFFQRANALGVLLLGRRFDGSLALGNGHHAIDLSSLGARDRHLGVVELRAGGAGGHEVGDVLAMRQAQGVSELVGADAGDRLVDAAFDGAELGGLLDEAEVAAEEDAVDGEVV